MRCVSEHGKASTQAGGSKGVRAPEAEHAAAEAEAAGVLWDSSEGLKAQVMMY